MWETNVRTTVTEIIDNLRQEKPNLERIAFTVSDLAVEVGNQNLPGLEGPDGPPIMKNHKACEIWTELQSLEAALSERNVRQALEHANATLRML